MTLKHRLILLLAGMVVFRLLLQPPAVAQQRVPVWASHALMIGYDDSEAKPSLLKMAGFPKKTKGQLVTKVYQGSPADKAGLKEGDLIVVIDEVTAEDKRFSNNLYKLKSVGSTHVLKVLRGGETLELSLTTVYPPKADDPTYQRDQQDAGNAVKLMREMLYQAYLGNNDRAYGVKGDLRDWVRNKIQQSLDEGHPLQAEKFRLLLKEL